MSYIFPTNLNQIQTVICQCWIFFVFFFESILPPKITFLTQADRHKHGCLLIANRFVILMAILCTVQYLVLKI